MANKVHIASRCAIAIRAGSAALQALTTRSRTGSRRLVGHRHGIPLAAPSMSSPRPICQLLQATRGSQKLSGPHHHTIRMVMKRRSTVRWLASPTTTTDDCTTARIELDIASTTGGKFRHIAQKALGRATVVVMSSAVVVCSTIARLREVTRPANATLSGAIGDDDDASWARAGSAMNVSKLHRRPHTM